MQKKVRESNTRLWSKQPNRLTEVNAKLGSDHLTLSMHTQRLIITQDIQFIINQLHLNCIMCKQS